MIKEMNDTISINGSDFNVRVARDTDWKARNNKMRAYVWGPGDELDETNLERVAKQVGAPNIYTKRGDYPLLDKAWDAHNKMIVAAKRSALEVVLNAIKADTDKLKIKFSRKAGCSCGCSPGFIIEGEAPRGTDMFIERKKVGSEKPAEQQVDMSYVNMAEGK
jgi:hypothetical protein